MEEHEAAAAQSYGVPSEVEQKHVQVVEREGDVDRYALEFLDSVDGYLTLVDSLSSVLRQGWLELASARHSMGSMRVNGALFDLKDHSASTHLQVTKPDTEGSNGGQPHFSLHKWVPFENGESCYGELSKEKMQKRSESPQLRERVASKPSETQEMNSEKNDSQLRVNDPVKKERSKMLSVFGTMVSPKLRSAQVSFETALDILVEAANVRYSMLSAHHQVKRGLQNEGAGKRSPEVTDSVSSDQ